MGLEQIVGMILQDPTTEDGENKFREDALLDLWLSYCDSNYKDTGRQLSEVATDFLLMLELIGCYPFDWEREPHDEQWLVRKYHENS